MPEDLEVVIREKIRPAVDATLEQIGSLEKFATDLAARLDDTCLVDINVDTRLGYRDAKRKFKKQFLRKLLLLHYGNVSEVARVTGKNRRSIHRLIRKFAINIRKIKKELIRPYDIELNAVSSAVEHVLQDYRGQSSYPFLKLYADIPAISGNILDTLPRPTLSFEAAQKNFETRYFKKALKENSHSVLKTAKRIGLRQETLYRKLRSLSII